jgi:hypothetical protein|tara:strand:+ start:69 stop:452 length:384 start_codon:yes stop_codon:yes gene_type:complete
MADKLLNITMTEEEVQLLLLCIDTNRETIKRRDDATTGINQDLLQQLAEMDMDIREQAFRDDGWDTDTTTFLVAEDDFIQRGMDAAELAKTNRLAAHSRAQERRNERMMKGAATPCHPDFMNDPADW